MRLFLIALFLLTSTPAFADWYIFNTENRCTGKTSYQPDQADVESRGEFLVQSDLDIAIDEAEYVNGKVVQRVKSQEEKNAEQAKADEINEMKIIYHQMFEEAYKAAVKKGHTFKKMDKHVDNVDKVTKEAQDEKVIEDTIKDEKIEELQANGITMKALKKTKK